MKMIDAGSTYKGQLLGPEKPGNSYACWGSLSPYWKHLVLEEKMTSIQVEEPQTDTVRPALGDKTKIPRLSP